MGLAVARRTVLVEQVIGELERQVQSGSWALGERLPSETQLAEQLGVGRSTVREGLEMLAARLAATRRTDDDVLRLEAALTRRRRARSASRIQAFVDADLD